MKRKLLLIQIFILMMSNCIAQSSFSREYKIDVATKDMFCHLYLFDNNDYELLMRVYTGEDVSYTFSVSKGGYTVKGNILTLSDKNWKFSMIFEMSECTLIPIKSYYLIKNSEILCYSDNNKDYPSRNYILTEKIRKKTKDFKMKNDKASNLNCGVYYSNCFVDSLMINAGGDYIMMKQGNIISRGTWKKKKDKLVLHDVDIVHDFEMLIGDCVLMSVNAPFDWGGSLYYLSEKDSFY
ncbi:MAG: hypothetical protein MJZ90_11550 [Bacteroidales bacterium]|nr:hypothetical protein [Bacteroidales bacterium]